MKITAKIDEKDFRAIRIGDKVLFTVDLLPGQSFKGEVSLMSRAEESAQHSTITNLVVMHQTEVCSLSLG